jgi:hypothetical protein
MVKSTFFHDELPDFHGLKVPRLQMGNLVVSAEVTGPEEELSGDQFNCRVEMWR